MLVLRRNGCEVSDVARILTLSILAISAVFDLPLKFYVLISSTSSMMAATFSAFTSRLSFVSSFFAKSVSALRTFASTAASSRFYLASISFCFLSGSGIITIGSTSCFLLLINVELLTNLELASLSAELLCCYFGFRSYIIVSVEDSASLEPTSCCRSVTSSVMSV